MAIHSEKMKQNMYGSNVMDFLVSSNLTGLVFVPLLSVRFLHLCASNKLHNMCKHHMNYGLNIKYCLC